MLSKKKKIFVLSGMVALLVLTGVLNVVLNNRTKETPVNADNYESIFATYRADRIASRQQTMLYYDAIIKSAASSAEAKAAAEASQAAILANMELETVLEGVLKGCGFADAFITCSTVNVNIIVKQETLTQEEADKILDVVLRETDRDATNVIVTPIK